MNDKAPLFAGLPLEEVKALLESLFGCPPGEERLLGKAGALWRLSYGPVSECADGEPLVLVSSAGTGLAGTVVEHLKMQLRNPCATVLLVGYQPPGSPGDQLKTLAAKTPDDRSKETLHLNEHSIPASEVRAALTDLSPYYSGHADAKGLVDFVLKDEKGKATVPATVFLNHGSAIARRQLKERLAATANQNIPGYRKLRDVLLPTPDDGWYDLVRNAWEDSQTPVSADWEKMQIMLTEILNNQREILTLLKSGK